MYDNCKIIYPSYEHKYSVILLHGMDSAPKYFDNLIDYLSSNHIYSHILTNTKFIFPEAPIMNINFPNNTLVNVNSWYNYYTRYDNLNKIDLINTLDFRYQTIRILNIILSEYMLLKGNNKNIYIGGISQGGTIAYNLLSFLPFNIGGLISIKSIFMYKYTKLKKYNIKSRIYMFNAEDDEVYNSELQNNCIKRLKNIGYKINLKIIPYLDHNTITNNEHDFIAKILIKKNKLLQNNYI